jgi:hypothetical protein
MGFGDLWHLHRTAATIAIITGLAAFAGVELVFAPPAAGPPAASAAVARAPAKPDPKLRQRYEPAPNHDPELPAVSNAAGQPLEVSGECERNLAVAGKHGLRLPAGWDIRCVGPGLDWNGNSHWGVTCPYDSCPEPGDHYVSISKPTYYVIAHELCHANFGNDELMADRCAAEHGASLAESPYQ